MAATAKASKGIKAEATGQLVDFEYRGEVYTVTADPKQMDVEVIEAMEEGRVASAAKFLVGPEQWAKFKASQPKPNVGDLADFFQAMSEALGWGN